MVKGNPLKLMVQFALPLLLGNLLQQTYNIIDAAIVGQILGAKALASVGATSSVQFLVLGFCIGICAGFGVPVAKYFGAEKKDTMRNYIFNGAVLTAGAAVVLTSACVILCNQIDPAYSFCAGRYLCQCVSVYPDYLSGNPVFTAV